MTRIRDDDHPSTGWRYDLLGLLESNEIHRGLTTGQLMRLVRCVRPRASSNTIYNAIGGLAKARALERLSRGLYLNRRSRPPVEVAEAAQHIRRGAVVSLESVLGECGFLNNAAAIVTAVVPQRPEHAARAGVVKKGGGQVFLFHVLPSQFFPASAEDERLLQQAGRNCPMSKPEVAVLQWLHLALSPRSSMGIPPQGVDFSVLDSELLTELACRWGLSVVLYDWQQRSMQDGDIKEPSEIIAQVSEEQRQRGLDARRRLIAHGKRKAT